VLLDADDADDVAEHRDGVGPGEPGDGVPGFASEEVVDQ